MSWPFVAIRLLSKSSIRFSWKTKVHAAVVEQQTYETTLVKSLLHKCGVATPTTGAANPAPALNSKAIDGLAKDKALLHAAAALVVPVRHTVTIRPEL
jgi:hypothetical protein